MIKETPFFNPFKQEKKLPTGEVIETYVKNGKTYKRVVRK